MRPTITVQGNVGQDPDMRFSDGGKAWCRFSIAYTSRRKGDGGEWEDGETTWYTVKAFSSLAEAVGDNVRKGNRVLVSGRFEMETWETDDGSKRMNPVIIADSIGIVPRAVQGSRPDEAPF